MFIANYIVVITIFIMKSSFGQVVVKEESCQPHPPLIEKFNPAKALGVWYAQKIGDPIESLRNCLKYNLELRSNELLMHKSWKYGNVNQNEEVTGTNVNGTSMFLVGWPLGMMAPGWIVDTDYNSFAIWYACVPLHQQRGVVFLVTRERNPGKSVMEKANSSLGKLGFELPPNYLLKVNQTGCS